MNQISSIKEKLLGKWRIFKNRFPGFSRDGVIDILAYIVILVGLLFMLFDRFRFMGEMIVGIVTGLYFTTPLINMLNNIRQIVDRIGIVHSVILSGFLAGLLIAAPMIFIGIIAGVVIGACFFL